MCHTYSSANVRASDQQSSGSSETSLNIALFWHWIRMYTDGDLKHKTYVFKSLITAMVFQQIEATNKYLKYHGSFPCFSW